MSIKYFPYAPNIPFEVKYDRFILPKLETEVWNRAITNRDIVIAGFGGLFEAYCSLYFLEACNFIYPSKKLYWQGNEKLSQLYQLNGLAKKLEQDVELINYPIPLFLDKENYTFIHYMYNYLDVYSYYRCFGYTNTKSAVQQVFTNLLFPCLEEKYKPQFRNINQKEFDTWCGINKFYPNKPYLVIIPEETGMSMHPQDCLKWGTNQVRALVSSLEQKNIATVIVSDNPGKYYGLPSKVMPPNIGLILQLLPNAKFILSKEVDYLLLSMLMSKAHVFSADQRHALNLKKNAKFLECPNELTVLKTTSSTEITELILKGNQCFV